MEAGLMKNSLVTGTTWMCYSVCLRSIVPRAIVPRAIVIARNCQHAIVGAQLSCALMTGYRHESLTNAIDCKSSSPAWNTWNTSREMPAMWRGWRRRLRIGSSVRFDWEFHVLRPICPPTADRKYNLRPRPHDFVLPPRDDNNYLPRVMYKWSRAKPL